MVTDPKQVSFFWCALEAIPLAGGCCIRSSVVGLGPIVLQQLLQECCCSFLTQTHTAKGLLFLCP